VKKFLLFLLLVGAGLAGIAVWINLPRTLSVSEGIFTYAAVEKGTMVETISATGVVQIEPDKLLIISSDMPGMVMGIAHRVNERVHEGDVLARLDDRRLKLKLEEANNGVQTAAAALTQVLALQEAARLALDYQKSWRVRSSMPPRLLSVKPNSPWTKWRSRCRP
jgi:multidrug efflux pump subunit AcrA (membrane-fusion protein)